MPTCGSLTAHNTTSVGGPPNCNQVNQNWDALVGLLELYCAGPTRVYFEGQGTTTLNVVAGNLPVGSPKRINVFLNGNRLVNDTLAAASTSPFTVTTGYTITDASNIELTFTPSGVAGNADIVIEYWPDPS